MRKGERESAVAGRERGRGREGRRGKLKRGEKAKRWRNREQTKRSRGGRKWHW